ncbi:vacuolar ATP synthase subunit h [Bacteroides helcogenes P 36-108]|uniref:Vacuolar ATP synthase subunit h n=1 Tax=Bacteroides helcogenes (strain ATCC 35417 / DSM 20613 / JCM 6297 / CCUG 15421 / P 36-108) TaxID=693979 RepID=E6SWF9_BACT6|nr:vacuolar ATP synthase subunit h [Bacteroides helcogenes P 36-108]
MYDNYFKMGSEFGVKIRYNRLYPKFAAFHLCKSLYSVFLSLIYLSLSSFLSGMSMIDGMIYSHLLKSC